MRLKFKTDHILLCFSLILPAILITGCSHRIGDFSILSSGVPQYASMERATITQTVEGKDSRFWFLFIPLGGAPNLEEAVDRCLDAGNGDFIERVRLYDSGWSILLFSYGGYKVIGDVGNSRILKPEVRKTEVPKNIPAAPAVVPVQKSETTPLAPVQAQLHEDENIDAAPVHEKESASGSDQTSPENIKPETTVANDTTPEIVHADAADQIESEDISIKTEDLGGLLSEENP